MQDELRKIIDPMDGGLMFCYSKRGDGQSKIQGVERMFDVQEEAL